MLFKRAYGCLMGTACGDAMGMPAYFTPAETRSKIGWIDRFLDAPDDHPVHRGLAAGRVTDDTQQAMHLAAAIIEDGGLTVEGVARQLVRWYESVGGDDSPYVGPSTKRAMVQLRQGADPHQTGFFGETNGAAMRIAPVGIINPGNIDAAVADAAISCTPTHFTNIAVSGASAIAAAIATGMAGAERVHDVIEAAKEGALIGVGLGRRVITPNLARRIELAVEIASQPRPVPDRLEELFDLTGAGLAISEVVPTALGVFVMAEGDPVRTAIYAANVSGDADTVAAIAGAVAGAFTGIDAFPAEFIDTIIRANPEYDFEGTARALAEIAIARPREWRGGA